MDEHDIAERVDRLGHALPASRPPIDLVRGIQRRRRRRRTTVVAVAAAAVVVAVGVAGVALDDPGTVTEPAEALSTAAVDELTATDGEPCPVAMPHEPGSDGLGFGTSEPAPAPPTPPVAERGWVCAYSSELGGAGPDASGDYVHWVRTGSAVGLDPDRLAAATATLSGLVPEDVDACTDDLGPRWLLVTATGDDLTGYAVDDFGCRTIRMTDDPAVHEPGVATQPGTVPGALEGADDLVEVLTEAYESVPAGALLDPLTVTLDLGSPRPDGRIPSSITLVNDSARTVRDSHCAASNYSWGLVPVDEPGGELSGRTMTRCAGSRDFPPGFVETTPGPVFDPRDLPAGDYLATIDLGDARGGRLATPVEVR